MTCEGSGEDHWGCGLFPKATPGQWHLFGSSAGEEDGCRAREARPWRAVWSLCPESQGREVDGWWEFCIRQWSV